MKSQKVLCHFLIGVAIVSALLVGCSGCHRVYRYQVGPDYEAYLVVKKGDTVKLVSPSGPNPNLQMNFLGGDGPCQKNGLSKCVINGPDMGGEYLFSCGLNGGVDQCPDPGLQQKPTNTTTMMFSQATVTVGGSDYLYCNKIITTINPTPTTTILGQKVPGNPSWQPPNSLIVPHGDEMIWNTHDTLTFNPPNGPCSAPPTNNKNGTYSCVLSVTGQYSYTVKMDSCSNPSGSEVITVQ